MEARYAQKQKVSEFRVNHRPNVMYIPRVQRVSPTNQLYLLSISTSIMHHYIIGLHIIHAFISKIV